MSNNQQESDLLEEPIAIIGAGCRFPGAANLDAFWQSLTTGKCTTGKIAEDRWNLVKQTSDSVHEASRYAGLIDGISECDFSFFGITRREGRMLDPQQRLLLEVSWEALEHAGVSLQSLQHSNTGVFVGISTFEYSLLQSKFIKEAHLGTGNAFSIAANRLSYFYNLTGPSMAIDTACSSSISATCLAVDNLRQNRCNMAIVGGANALLNLRFNDVFSEAGMLSADGKCKSFDASANGYVRSEGCGVVILKRLSDAIANGDRVLACIRNTGMNQDGRSNGITAPNGLAQERLLREVYSSESLQGRLPDYIETHGTGTPLGDPIEFRALNTIYQTQEQSGDSPCLLGSVKTNIGHLEAAAGIAGLIKTALSIYHRTIPPSLHFNQPNPALDYENARIKVCTKLTDWPSSSSGNILPLAGLSSFGFGGTNTHLVLEGVPIPKKTKDPVITSGKLPILLNAHSQKALKAMKSDMADFIESQPHLKLAELATHLAHRRSLLGHRFVCLAEDKTALISMLRTGSAQPASTSGRHRQRDAIWEGEHHPLGADPVVYVFSGQGSHTPGMAKAMVECFPEFDKKLKECADIIHQFKGPHILEELGLTATAEKPFPSQPAFVAYQIALASILNELGIVPEAVTGHSLGEITAAHIAGVFTLEQALQLAVSRGKAMSNPLTKGNMLACLMSAEETRLLLKSSPNSLDIAAENAPEITVVSGDSQEIKDFAKRLPEHRSIPLKGDQAFHSILMAEATTELENTLNNWIDERNEVATIPFYSTCDASLKESHELGADYWSRQLRDKVRFRQTITQLEQDGFVTFIEVGASPVLKKAIEASLPKELFHVLETMNPRLPALESLSRLGSALFATGHSIQWNLLVPKQAMTAIHLPTYPWQHESLWSVSESIPEPQSGLPITPNHSQNTSLTMNRDTILNELRHSVAKIIGSAPEEVSTSAPFIEMGADSVLLAQAAHGIESRFNVKINLRQFFEELYNLEALAEFIAEHAKDLDEESPTHTQQGVPQLPSSTSQDGDIKTILNRQLDILSQVMNQQMDILTQGGSSLNKSAQLIAPAKPQPAPKPPSQSVGPYRPPSATINDAKPLEHLSEIQRQHLQSLCSRLTLKTAKSKQRASEARPRFADCRASAGFRPSIKEMLYPIEIEKAKGCQLTDIDGNVYTDISMDFGVNLFGHKPDFLIEAWHTQIDNGVSLSGRSPHAADVAELLCDLTGMDRCAFCQSGTESLMVAARLARLATGRSQIAYFTHSYHGHFDGFLALPGMDGQTAIPAAPGISEAMINDALVLPFGSDKALQVLRENAHSLAAVFVEPVQSRHPELQPKDFLKQLRQITSDSGTVLVFDEMITGFRIHPGGSQAHFGVKADLATYGKVLGGGQPIAAIAGNSQLMDGLDGGTWTYGDTSYPTADTTFFAGTFTGNPLALASAKAILQRVQQEGPNFQAQLNAQTQQFADELNAWFEEEEMPVRIVAFGSLFRFAFSGNLDLLFYHLLDKGIFIWEGRNCFFSAAHTAKDIERISQAIRESCEELREGDFIPEHSKRPTNDATVKPLSLPDHPSEALQVPTMVPATEAQRQLWMLSQIDPLANLAYTESILIHVEGNLDSDILCRAFTNVIKRHESLRTTFSEDGRHQIIHPDMAVSYHLVDASMLIGTEQDTAREDFFETMNGQAFDFKNGPLVRMGVCRMSQDTQLISIVGHHIVFDGWSLNLMINDIAIFYSAELGQVPFPQSPAPQFREYVQWLETSKNTLEMKRQKDFWRERLKAPIPSFEFPYDLPAPAKWTWEGNRISSRITPSLRKSIETLGKGAGATLFMTLLTAFQSYLHRLTGKPDLLIGSPVLGRSMPHSLEIIGYLTHIVPVISRLDIEKSFLTFLAQQKSELLDIFENQTLPFADLIRLTEIDWLPDQAGLVQVTFNLDRPREGVRLHGLKMELVSSPVNASKFAINVNITDLNGELLLELDYNSNLISKQLATTVCNGFVDWLRKLCEHPDEPLSQVALGELPSNQPLLKQDDFPNPFNKSSLIDAFMTTVKRCPEDVAVIAAARDGKTENQLTYQELHQRSEALAAKLVSLGVKLGDTVGIRTRRGLDRIIGILGIIKAGAIYVPIDTKLPQKRVSLMLEETQSRFLVADSDTDEIVTGSSNVTVLAASQNMPSEHIELPQVSLDDLAYVMFTSGSTGKPKGVAVTHHNVMSLLASLQLRGNSPEGAHLLHSPASFDASTMQVWWPLINGYPLVIAPPDTLSLKDYGQVITSYHIVDTFLPTGLFNLLVTHESEALSHMKRIIVGGSIIHPEKCKLFMQRCPHTLLNHGYGPTETTVFAVMHKVTQMDVERGSIPIGDCLPTMCGWILDDCMQPVPDHVSGELYLSGYGVSAGYYNRLDITEKAFVPNPFSDNPSDRLYKTGDLVRRLSSGKIKFVKRRDNQVKLRGVRLELEEVESILKQHPDVSDAITKIVALDEDDSRFIAYLVLNNSQTSFPVIATWLEEFLPVYMRPDHYHVIDQIPLNENGKPDRRQLKAPTTVEPLATKQSDNKQSETETKVLKIWESLLKCQVPSRASLFFELGGHSLLFTEMVARITETFLVPLTLREAMDHLSVESLAKLLDSKLAEGHTSSNIPRASRNERRVTRK
ncbi:MAG: amino acid adenylation domain-containing protein [Akkermansiaceae bacterium]